MSWEGFYQAICERGHLYEGDAADRCPRCDQRACWMNAVSDTNGDHEGYIFPQDFAQFYYKDDAEGLPTYLVPSEEDVKPLRTCFTFKRIFVYAQSGKRVRHPWPHPFNRHQ